MFRARISYKFVALAGRVLPQRAAHSLVKTLRLKIPTTPEALAAVLLTMSGSILKGLEKTKTDLHADGITKRDEIAEIDKVAGEVLCALYCLAAAIIGKDEFAADSDVFHIYTARTFEEIEILLAELPTMVSLENLINETTNLYLRERPSLSEMALQLPRYISGEELRKVEEMKNWTASFALKAMTRILAQLGTPIGGMAAEFIGASFQIALLHGIDLFKKMRPVFVEPN